MAKIDLVEKKETTAAEAAPTTTMSRNKGAPDRAVRAKKVCGKKYGGKYTTFLFQMIYNL